MKVKLVALAAMLGLFFAIAGYAGVEDAKAAYDKGDYAKALQEAMPLAQHGSADAQKLLGVMYANGQGLPKDYTKAIEWFSKAAEQGHAGAQRNLGLMYVNGLGVPQDYAKAAELFRKAAEQENADAQYYLGFMYYKGQGVPQDYAQAVEWYRKSAEQGNAMAQNNLGRMYEYGLGVPKDYAQAVDWYRKAAKQGLEKAQVNLRVLLSAASDISETIVSNGKGEPAGSINKDRIVLMPLLLDENDQSLESALNAALVEELSKKYEVLSGVQIEENSREKLLKMFKAKQDDTKVARAIAKSLHSNFYARVEITKGYSLSLFILNSSNNTPHKGIVAGRISHCDNCDVSQVAQKIKSMVGEVIASGAKDAEVESCKKNKLCYCSNLGSVYENSAKFRDDYFSPEQAFRLLAGVYGKTFSDKVIKNAINQVYLDSGFFYAGGHALQDQMMNICLGNIKPFKPLK
ncbi:MAG: Sel1 repeat family protein [Candidatus Gallionella acididurans]|uniref:Sel1 repeat family protein n=1 Tax=Candidatus Gallionella acididurans TaxID=1796491 RepID=A0A139BW41_9PROT|nr:MAG: Sel1 repeat family protein [Candidatus Gallionella acididurans]